MDASLARQIRRICHSFIAPSPPSCRSPPPRRRWHPVPERRLAPVAAQTPSQPPSRPRKLPRHLRPQSRAARATRSPDTSCHRSQRRLTAPPAAESPPSAPHGAAPAVHPLPHSKDRRVQLPLCMPVRARKGRHFSCKATCCVHHACALTALVSAHCVALRTPCRKSSDQHQCR
eukprot:SAG11_NODE_2856_length_2901_cov_3.495717_3_plen_174_part_00